MTSKVYSLITDERFVLVRDLGEGSFACVKEYQDTESNHHVAIKHIYVQRPFLGDVMGEVKHLRSCQSNHIIRLHDSFYDGEELFLNLVMELCVTSLRGQIQARRVFVEKELVSFLVQITSAFL